MLRESASCLLSMNCATPVKYRLSFCTLSRTCRQTGPVSAFTGATSGTAPATASRRPSATPATSHTCLSARCVCNGPQLHDNRCCCPRQQVFSSYLPSTPHALHKTSHVMPLHPLLRSPQLLTLFYVRAAVPAGFLPALCLWLRVRAVLGPGAGADSAPSTRLPPAGACRGVPSIQPAPSSQLSYLRLLNWDVCRPMGWLSSHQALRHLLS